MQGRGMGDEGCQAGVVGKPIGVLSLPANNKSDTRNIIKRFSMEYKA